MGKYRASKLHRRLGEIAEGCEEIVAIEIEQAAKDATEKMKQNLEANGSVDTGKLKESIHYTFEEKGHTKGKWAGTGSIVARIYADAKSDDGELYYEFVEYGTGVHNEHGDGRKTPWKWKDRHGKWHTTTGYQAKPFIRPALSEVIPALRKRLKKAEMIKTKKKGAGK